LSGEPLFFCQPLPDSLRTRRDNTHGEMVKMELDERIEMENDHNLMVGPVKDKQIQDLEKRVQILEAQVKKQGEWIDIIFRGDIV